MIIEHLFVNVKIFFLPYSSRIPKQNSKAFYMRQNTAHDHCTVLGDVSDSKCASSFIVPAEKVVAIQALFMYNGISKFNIPPAHPS